MSEPQKSEPQNGRGALFAGGLAAILASACCLGPLVLIALGFSGAWIGNLTVLEPYRPFFIGAALVAPGGASTARRKPANRVRSARFPRELQAHFLDRGRAGPGLARISLRHAIFLLITGVHHEKLFAALALAAVVAPCGRHPDRHAVRAGMTCASCPITSSTRFPLRA
ncbi:hypothetical protein BANRA_05706 [Klebsiella pneumoniae]|nr:hypothetical protein BANRA_05706 [Klebsiella pneumoniae]